MKWNTYIESDQGNEREKSVIEIERQKKREWEYKNNVADTVVTCQNVFQIYRVIALYLFESILNENARAHKCMWDPIKIN